jgi:hypothetical protein
MRFMEKADYSQTAIAASLRPAVSRADSVGVSPMCQYVTKDGVATPWHAIHFGTMALSGAGMLCIEARACSPPCASPSPNTPNLSIERDVVRMAPRREQLSENFEHLKRGDDKCVLVIRGEPCRHSEENPIRS